MEALVLADHVARVMPYAIVSGAYYRTGGIFRVPYDGESGECAYI